MPDADKTTYEKRSADMKKRLDDAVFVLQKVSLGDFSVRMKLTEKEDELSALMAGINLMIDDLESSAKEKGEKIAELEILNKLAVNRELKMIELKKEIEELRRAQGKNIATPL